MKSILITGGAGFIGSHFVRLAVQEMPGAKITVIDKLTYAGNLANLANIKNKIHFIHGDIADSKVVSKAFKGVEAVAHFAAETHVDRSIGEPDAFLRTNVFGTYTLLEAARRNSIKRFLHVSTDEVYGSRKQGRFKEEDRLNPSSPYSASKASSDLLALSYFTTYGLPVVVSRCSNNYGPNQYPEKLIPLFITNLCEGKKVPVYGNGSNRRDWIYVEDHCQGLMLLLKKGQTGQIYNLAGGQEADNLRVTHDLLKIMGLPLERIEYVKDRPGHDWRYAIDDSKARRLGFRPQFNFKTGLKKTVAWYLENKAWWAPLKSGEFLRYYQKQYFKRG